MFYHEYALKPELRNGTMIPRSALLDIYAKQDSGYCTVFAFDALAVAAIRAQGDSKGFGRFAVYSDRLWMDFDAANSSETEVRRVKEYVREVTQQLIKLDYSFTVWFSGSKGYHICIKITPMQGNEVPWSQLQYVQQVLKVSCDFSLYQHGRLLSNPGRLHPKTGKRKEKIFEHQGNTILTVPMVPAPEKSIVDTDTLSGSDLARIALHRVSSLILDASLIKPGERHTKLWSMSYQCAEANMPFDLVTGLALWANTFLPDSKSEAEVCRAVNQAFHQAGR